MSRANNQAGDYEIRTALRSRLQREQERESDTVVIEELGLCRGQVRVDLAVVNGMLHGYEIKSDRDSLRRLDGQMALYNKVLDRATLVVGNRHLNAARAILPRWWGIIRVDPSECVPKMASVRRGGQNPGRDPRALVELLWLEEAMSLLEDRDAARGIRGKPRRFVWDRVCECLEIDEIASAVRKRIKARAKLGCLQ